MSSNQLSTHPSTHVEHERTEHKMSRLQQHTHTKGWRFASESPWAQWHTGGSWQGHPRHTGARTGKAVGGPTSSTTRRQTNDNLTKTCVKTNVLPAKPGVDTLGNLHGSGAARRSQGKRAVERNTMSTLSTSRSGDVPDHHEDRAEKRKITQEKVNQETMSRSQTEMVVRLAATISKRRARSWKSESGSTQSLARL